MIHITSQDALHQYDEDGNAITTWHGKKCAWIVNPEYEKEEINWWGEDNDFARAYQSIKDFERENPNWNKMPDIEVTWFWNTKSSAIAAFGQPSSFLPYHHKNISNYWDIQEYPYTATRKWGYIDESKETTIERFGKYCDFYKKADRVIVKYNDEILFDGKLK